MSDRRYPIAYHVEPGDYSKAQLQAQGLGGTDAVVLFSVIREHLSEPHKGTKSIAMLSLDGHTKQNIPDTELFQVFAHLAHTLMGARNVTGWQRRIAAQTFTSMQTEVMKGRTEAKS